MVRLVIEFQTDGVSFDFDAGAFASRQDALEVADMIERETETAALDGEDVTYLRHRIEEVSKCL